MELLDLGMTTASTWHVVKKLIDGDWTPACGSGGKVTKMSIGGKIVINAGEPFCFKCQCAGNALELPLSTTTSCKQCGHDFGPNPSYYGISRHKHMLMKESYQQ